MAELKTGMKMECDTDVGWELVREWTEGEGVRLKKREVAGMKNHVCLNTTRISDWLKQVASRKNTQMRLSHNRRRCRDGVSIDTARINIHLALYINISIFF